MNILSLILGFALLYILVGESTGRSCHSNLTGLSGNIYFNIQYQNIARGYASQLLTSYNCSWKIIPPDTGGKFVLIFRLAYLNSYKASDKIQFPDDSSLKIENTSFPQNALCKMYTTSNIPLSCVKDIRRQSFCPNTSIVAVNGSLILKSSASTRGRKYIHRYYYYYSRMQFIIGYWLHFCPDPVNTPTNNFGYLFARAGKAKVQGAISTHKPMTDVLKQNNTFTHNLVVAALGVLTLLCGIVIVVLAILLRKKRMKHPSLDQKPITNQVPDDGVQQEANKMKMEKLQERNESTPGYLSPTQPQKYDDDDAYETIKTSSLTCNKHVTSSLYVNSNNIDANY